MNNQRGLTLVELMISMSLGLLLSAGVVTLFVQSQQSYGAVRELSLMDQNAQILVDVIEADLQRVGYFHGCKPATGALFANNIKAGAHAVESAYGTSLRGYSSAATANTLSALSPSISGSLKANSDFLMMMVADPARQGLVQSVAAVTSPNVTVRFDDDAKAQTVDDINGQIIQLSTPDCGQSAQIIASGASATSAGTTVFQLNATGASGSLGNCTVSKLAGDFDCNASRAAATEFSPGGPAVVLDYLGYGVIDTVSKPNTLVKIVRNNKGTADSFEMLRGVESLSIEYGVAANSANTVNNVQSVSKYLTAAELDAAPAIGGNYNQMGWDQVISVRLGFTLISPIKVQDQEVKKTYKRVIALRNRVVL